MTYDQMNRWPHSQVFYYVRNNTVWHAVSFNSRLQQTESYEAVNNSTGAMLFISCPDWGVNSNTFLYDFCPHNAQTNDNGNMQSYTQFNGGAG